MEIDSQDYRFIVTRIGTVEASFVGKRDSEDPERDFVTDNREVGNMLLLAIAERLERLIQLTDEIHSIAVHR